MRKKRRIKIPCKQQESSNNELSKPCPIDKNLKMALRIIEQEFLYERQRSTNLDSRIGIFISAIYVILALIISQIDSTMISKILKAGSVSFIQLLYIMSVAICVSSTLLSLVILTVSVTARLYHRFNYDKLTAENNLHTDSTNFAIGIIKHYHGIIEDNDKVNEKKARGYQRGLICSIISIVSFVFSYTMQLIII